MRYLFILVVAQLLGAFFGPSLGDLVATAHAAEPPATPILRVETGMHTAAIYRIDADAAGRWLVTASDDKSLRVWNLSTGKLDRTIRPPIGEGNEGKLYSVAISPDGSTIACGGFTQFNNGQFGLASDGVTIYFFNRASGRMTARINGLPETINHLAFSSDGRHLAASLGDNHGIRLYRSSDWSLVGEDKEYGSKSTSAHFSSEGRLLTTSYDGFIRLYETGGGKLRLVSKVKAPGGSRPGAARFSPDNNRIAVGYDDTANISVLSAQDLSQLYSPDMSGADNRAMPKVAWSADGRFLFAGGYVEKQFDGAWKRVIRRWSESGRGSYSDTAAATSNIVDIIPLTDGRIAYCAGGPAFGLLDQTGKQSLFVPSVIADYRDSWEKFLISNNGAKVSFGYEPLGKSAASFNLGSRSLTLGDSADSLGAPATVAKGLAIDGWKYTAEPKLNTVPLKLEQYELSHSLAIAPDGNSFVLGASWHLYRFDRKGKLLWSVPVPGVVWTVNVSGNGSVVIAAYADGSIRWHRMTDGKELAAFFPHEDKKRWVLWTPSGYYDASPGGEELIGWHLNNGKEATADFFPASKFRSTFYRPDVVSKVLVTLDEAEAIRLANAESSRKQSSATLAQLLPPVVSISDPDNGATASSASVTIHYTIRTPQDAPVTGVRVLIDGRPVPTNRGLKVTPKNTAEQSVTVSIPERDCEVSVIAENRHSTSVPATIRLVWGGKLHEDFTAKPNLYVLAVGVSAYKDKDLALKYAAKDARDFGAAVQKQKGGLYRDVSVKVLADAQATKDDVMDGLDWLQKEVTSRDVGMIFIAGHGVNDPAGIYYYLPQNADTNKLKRTGVAFSDIKNTLASLAGKAVLFVDTCHAGNVMGTRRGVADINAVVNELASTENGAVVFSSSTGKQYSLEDAQWGNGAFTKALVEGFSGNADYGGKGKITINMLDLYLSERVKELTKGQQSPATTKPHTIQDFTIAVRR